jgi:hypothetical protein
MVYWSHRKATNQGGTLRLRGWATTKYKNKYRIESARLPGWDYRTPGWYFVTICTQDRIPFKSVCTKRIRATGYPGFGSQPRFYDHIIRNDASLRRIRVYITNNPRNWSRDRFYPAGLD